MPEGAHDGGMRGADFELLVDVPEMIVGCGVCDVEFFRDVGLAKPLAHQPEHLCFTRRELEANWLFFFLLYTHGSALFRAV